MDCSPPGPSAQGFSRGEHGSGCVSSSRASSRPRLEPASHGSCAGGGSAPLAVPRPAPGSAEGLCSASEDEAWPGCQRPLGPQPCSLLPSAFPRACLCHCEWLVILSLKNFTVLEPLTLASWSPLTCHH